MDVKYCRSKMAYYKLVFYQSLSLSSLLLYLYSENVEVLIRLFIIVKNQNCQAYLCVFFVFPSSPLFCRFSIFSLLSFTFISNAIAMLFSIFFRASFRSVRASCSLVRSAVALHSPNVLKELSQTEMKLLKTLQNKMVRSGGR